MQKQTEIFKRVCAGLLAAALMVTLAACKPATPADAGCGCFEQKPDGGGQK